MGDGKKNENRDGQENFLLFQVALKNAFVKDNKSESALDQKHEQKAGNKSQVRVLHKEPGDISGQNKYHTVSQMKDTEHPADEREAKGYQEVDGTPNDRVDNNLQKDITHRVRVCLFCLKLHCSHQLI